MKFSALSRTGFAVALSAVLASLVGPAVAQEQTDSIFSQVAPSVRDRFFFRLNYVRANVKTTSGDARDVTGPVVGRGDIKTYLGPGSAYVDPNGPNASKNSYKIISDTLDAKLTLDANAGCESERAGLGTPCGIRARGAAMVGTPALSLGYYLDDDYNWALEALVLAAPMSVNAYGEGPNHLNGQNIIKMKLLPPTGMLGRYFGAKSDMLRPFIGIGASYAMFFDVKATEALNAYQGGSSVGDTSITIKNVIGFGPFVGLRSGAWGGWDVGVSVGKLRYKTEATLVTRNTVITEDSVVTRDYLPNAQVAIAGASTAGGLTELMCDLAMAKYGVANGCNQGTFVRKQSTVLDNTLFMLSVGHSF